MAKKQKTPLNGSGRTALGYRLILKVKKVESVTKGGIVLTQQSVSDMAMMANEGTIVSIGPTAWLRHEGAPEWAQIGDKVHTAKAAGSLFVGDDGEEYRIVNDEDILTREEA